MIGASLKIELAGPSSAFGTCQNSLQSAHRKKSRFGENRIPSSGTTWPLSQLGHCVRADINQPLHFRATPRRYLFRSFEGKTVGLTGIPTSRSGGGEAGPSQLGSSGATKRPREAMRFSSESLLAAGWWRSTFLRKAGVIYRRSPANPAGLGNPRISGATQLRNQTNMSCLCRVGQRSAAMCNRAPLWGADICTTLAHAVVVMRPFSACDGSVRGEMNHDAPWPEIERRHSAEGDRRSVPRGGRRRFDLPRAVTCVRCGARDVRALGMGLAGFWCVCRRCGYVFPV